MAAAPRIYPRPSTYWTFLLETLSSVFGRADAADLVARIKKEIQNAPAEEQLLFFHSEPLDIASMLTGTTASPAMVSSYLALVSQLNWAP